ncbi:DNA damage-induced apoptosis suppressor protein isoform 1-T2 [Hipposideros larvatus]
MNKRRKFLLASVLALQNSSFIYPSCQKCYSRVTLVSKRSNCPKCGSNGKVENASYRYKLSIKVAESNKLFGITVFGSCLDAFFGLTATDLHRYIQGPNEIPEALGSEATQNLLTKAVETCFVGQSFIFGVTNFENQPGQGSDSSNFLPQCPGRRREVKALVACQIVLPDPRVAGFTVIDYFHQLLQLSDFRRLHGGSQTPNSHLLALEHSGSDLSSIRCPDSSSYFFESHSRDNFLRFCQPSLELTSIVSQLTDDDNFSALEQSKAIDTPHQNRKCISFAEATGSNSCHEVIQGPWSLVSYMDKKSTAPELGQELGLQANQPCVVHSNHHEIGVTGSNLFPLKMQEALEPSNTKSFHSAVENKNRYSQCELTRHQHHEVNTPPSLEERPTYCPPSSLKLEEVAGGSQDCDPEMWDDLPFSESLNKFLAAIESEITITQTDASSTKCHLDNDIDKLHTDHTGLSVIPQRTTGALHTPPIALRSSQETGKANSGKDDFLSNYEANPTPNVQKESQPGHTAEAISISSHERDISEYFLPNAYLSALLPSSKGLGTTGTRRKSTKIPHRAEILLKHNTSENDPSCLSSKYFNGCGGKSLSEMSEKLTTLCSWKYNDVSDVCNLENKHYSSRWSDNQGDSLTICRKLTYPLEALCSSPNGSTNALEEVPYGHTNNLTQNYCPGHEGSYNVSADLFDDSAKETDVATEITKKSQDILLQWGKSLAKNHLSESDFSLRPLSESSSQSSQKLSLQNMSASIYPKTYSSPPDLQSDLENDFEDSRDFVPCSQSTPVAQFHQTRIHGMKGAFKKLPTFYSDLHVNYKKTKILSENEAQQATPSCPKNLKRPSQKSRRSPIMSGIAQPEVFNNYPVAECLESDTDEWVPPTTKRIFLSDMLRLQTMGLRKCPAACTPDQKELPRKKLKYVKQRTDKHLVKKELKNMLSAVVTKQETPNYHSTSSGWVSRESALGLDSCSEVKCCLPFSENCPPSVPETKSAWSPELFS